MRVGSLPFLSCRSLDSASWQCYTWLMTDWKVFYYIDSASILGDEVFDSLGRAIDFSLSFVGAQGHAEIEKLDSGAYHIEDNRQNWARIIRMEGS